MALLTYDTQSNHFWYWPWCSSIHPERQTYWWIYPMSAGRIRRQSPFSSLHDRVVWCRDRTFLLLGAMEEERCEMKWMKCNEIWSTLNLLVQFQFLSHYYYAFWLMHMRWFSPTTVDGKVHTCVVKNQTLPTVDVHGRRRPREAAK